jgi:IS66 C-terminal element
MIAIWRKAPCFSAPRLLNPQHYLADVLTRIADHPARRIAELLPWNWTSAVAKLAA